MRYEFESFSIEFVDLAKHPTVLREFIDGQKTALRKLGVSDDIAGDDDAHAPDGTYAAVARTAAGEIVGGLKIHTRKPGTPLPIESESSPLDPLNRLQIANEEGLCEVGGLWVSSGVAGRFLGQRIVACGTIMGYQKGALAVVGLSHARAFKFITAPLGYEIDTRIAAMAYPDERFQTIVVWHRNGLASALDNLKPRPARTPQQMPARAPMVTEPAL